MPSSNPLKPILKLTIWTESWEFRKPSYPTPNHSWLNLIQFSSTNTAKYSLTLRRPLWWPPMYCKPHWHSHISTGNLDKIWPSVSQYSQYISSSQTVSLVSPGNQRNQPKNTWNPCKKCVCTGCIPCPVATFRLKLQWGPMANGLVGHANHQSYKFGSPHWSIPMWLCESITLWELKHTLHENSRGKINLR